MGHSLGVMKGAERTSTATPGQTLIPAQHVLHRLELVQELLLPHTEVSQLVLCCLQSAFNSCNERYVYVVCWISVHPKGSYTLQEASLTLIEFSLLSPHGLLQVAAVPLQLFRDGPKIF